MSIQTGSKVALPPGNAFIPGKHLVARILKNPFDDPELSLPQLHVAMIVGSFSSSGGLELYAHKLVEGLLLQGVRVTVICQESPSEFRHPKLSFVYMHTPSKKLPKWRRLQEQFSAASAAVAENGPFDLVHSQHFPSAQADIVTFHNHTVNRLLQVGLGWEKILNAAKARLVRAYRLRQELDRTLCLKASCLIFPSIVMHDDFFASYEFLRNGNTPYIVAHPGADLSGQNAPPEKFTADSQGQPLPASERTTSHLAGLSTGTQLGLEPEQPFCFLFVGRGYRKKGLDVLLAACGHLAASGQNFKLLIAGLSRKPIDVFRLKTRGIEKHVEYLGFQKDMAAVYERARAIVIPSRLEPFGMAALQAMQWGLVPIVSAVSGVAEVLTDGVDSLILHDHLDAAGLARLMRRLMDDPRLTASLSQTASRTAKGVTWHQTVEETLRAYEIALSMRQAERSGALK